MHFLHVEWTVVAYREFLRGYNLFNDHWITAFYTIINLFSLFICRCVFSFSLPPATVKSSHVRECIGCGPYDTCSLAPSGWPCCEAFCWRHLGFCIARNLINRITELVFASREPVEAVQQLLDANLLLNDGLCWVYCKCSPTPPLSPYNMHPKFVKCGIVNTLIHNVSNRLCAHHVSNYIPIVCFSLKGQVTGLQ